MPVSPQCFIISGKYFSESLNDVGRRIEKALAIRIVACQGYEDPDRRLCFSAARSSGARSCLLDKLIHFVISRFSLLLASEAIEKRILKI